MPNPIRKNCIFTSAGDHHNLENWLGGNERSWDLITAYYGDSEEIRSRLDHVSDGFFSNKASKFQNLHLFFKNNPEALNKYDHIWVMDDDLIIPPPQIERMFAIAREWDFWVSQPAFNRSGKVSHEITAYDPASELRIVDFVEVTCPLFRTDKLISFLNEYDGSLVGWGIDYWFAHVLQSKIFRKFAVIDAVQILNPTDDVKGRIREIDTLQPASLRAQHANLVLGKLNISSDTPANIAWVAVNKTSHTNGLFAKIRALFRKR